MPLFHPLTLQRGKQPDVAVAVLEKQGFLHALLKQARVSPWAETPLVLVACWLADDARTASAGKLALLRRVAQSADLIVYWSSNQQAIYTDVLRVPEERLMFVPFGVEDSFYQPASTRTTERYVFSAGLDKGRDYATLIDALNGIDMPVRLAAPERALTGLRLADNIEPLGGVWGRDYLEQLSNATAVVIASRPEIAYPTGQTVILNAMATGVPVVATDTVPLRDYLRHEDNALLAIPRDPAALQAQVLRLLGDSELGRHLTKNGLEDVRERFNTRAMWRAVAERLAQL
jgi:glycosyltransferase involved in cell wall biosynthesis